MRVCVISCYVPKGTNFKAICYGIVSRELAGNLAAQLHCLRRAGAATSPPLQLGVQYTYTALCKSASQRMGGGQFFKTSWSCHVCR